MQNVRFSEHLGKTLKIALELSASCFVGDIIANGIVAFAWCEATYV